MRLSLFHKMNWLKCELKYIIEGDFYINKLSWVK